MLGFFCNYIYIFFRYHSLFYLLHRVVITIKTFVNKRINDIENP
jgi:hypothetical protein